GFIVDLLYILHLQEMIATAQGAQLGHAALLRTWGNGRRVRAIECTTRFGEARVALLAVAVLRHPAGAVREHPVEILGAYFDEACATRTARDIAKDLIDEIAQFGAHVGSREGAPYKTH